MLLALPKVFIVLIRFIVLRRQLSYQNKVRALNTRNI